MDFFEIKTAKITCSECKTCIIVPLNPNSFRLAQKKDFQFSCPNCGNDLAEIVAAARSYALHYNEACKKAEELKASGCEFEQF